MNDYFQCMFMLDTAQRRQARQDLFPYFFIHLLGLELQVQRQDWTPVIELVRNFFLYICRSPVFALSFGVSYVAPHVWVYSVPLPLPSSLLPFFAFWMIPKTGESDELKPLHFPPRRWYQFDGNERNAVLSPITYLCPCLYTLSRLIGFGDGELLCGLGFVDCYLWNSNSIWYTNNEQAIHHCILRWSLVTRKLLYSWSKLGPIEIE